MAYWTALQILSQVAGEIGLPRPVTIVGVDNVQSVQLLSLLNSAGNELFLYYNWEQLVREWLITTTAATDYPVPADLSHFTDQTQWDRSNHWPLMGPKSPQEWAWLKGSLVSTQPRLRYRIANDNLKIFPAPTVGLSLAMEYVSTDWVQSTSVAADPVYGANTSLVTLDADIVYYNPWLIIKFIKYKFYELKGLATNGVQADFVRIFESLTGKDTGAEILSLAPCRTEFLIDARSIPDGNWGM